jgi:hypothetical protein
MKIVISESQLKSIILEADRRSIIIDKIGYTEQWADEFIQFSEKYAVWIANKFRDLGQEKNSNFLNDLSSKEPSETTFWTDLKPKIQSILDWKIGDHNAQRIDLNTLSIEDAYKLSEDWHNSLNSKIQTNYTEKGKVFIDYRDNRGIGFYWVDLGKSYCSEEAERMGHCARGNGTLLSLRRVDKNGNSHSHVTADYDEGQLNQIKGKQNNKPIPEYHKYIVDLLINKTYPVSEMPDGKSYAPDKDFKLSDLNKDQLKYVYDNNPALRFGHLDKNNIEDFLNEIENGDIDFKLLDVSKLKKVMMLSWNMEKPIVKKIIEHVQNLGLSDRVKFIQVSYFLKNGEFIKFIHSDDEIMELFNNPEKYFNNEEGSSGRKLKISFIRFYARDIKRILVERNIINNIEDFKKFLILSVEKFDVSTINESFCDLIKELSDKFKGEVLSLLKGGVSRELLRSCTPVGPFITRYEEFTEVNDSGYFLFKKKGLWGAGFIDRKSKITIVLNPEFTRLNFDSENSVIGRIGDTIEKIDLLTGKKTTYKSRR